MSRRAIRPTGRVSALEVGVMMLDNTLPRPRGDVGHLETFDFGVGYEVIPDAGTARVVEHSAEGLRDAAIVTGRRLVELGARAVTTCCGFLAIFQRELASELDVPVATSSLLQVPLALQTLRPDQRVAVLTVNASTLTPAHFAAVGVDEVMLSTRVSVHGLEKTEHFYPMIVGKITELDADRAEAEVVVAAEQAVADDPTIGAFVLECTNLPPYADAIRDATDRPVWDATSLIEWLHLGVGRGRFSGARR